MGTASSLRGCTERLRRLGLAVVSPSSLLMTAVYPACHTQILTLLLSSGDRAVRSGGSRRGGVSQGGKVGVFRKPL